MEGRVEDMEEKLRGWFGELKWLNVGGGEVMRGGDYEVEDLIGVLEGVK